VAREIDKDLISVRRLFVSDVELSELLDGPDAGEAVAADAADVVIFQRAGEVRADLFR
jgi:hypothetical protein